MRHGQTQWTTADRVAAYERWVALGSLAKVASTLAIPVDTLESWCRREGWVARRQREDALAAEMALQRAYAKVVKAVDPLIESLLQIALSGDKEQSVQLSAVKHALAIVGIAPVERRVVTGRPADADAGVPALPDRVRERAEALLDS